MKIKDVLHTLECFAPLPLQESYDNAGLQIGLTEAEVSGVLLCLDITEACVEEAIGRHCNLIVSHHPLLFRPLKQITERDPIQRIVMKAIKNDVAVISMHTNLDNAIGGVNYKIAEKLGLQSVELLTEKCIPHISNNGETTGDTLVGGAGIIADLPQPMAARDFMQHLKTSLQVPVVQSNALLTRSIRRVAVCGGSGAFLLRDAVTAGADAFITGEMHYHDYFFHDQSIQICVIGHYESEQFTYEVFEEILRKHHPDIDCFIAHSQQNPILYL
ncbi:MAG: Nif3-like dinuclear metal center hexameric protein [Prevotella sp.]|nr:Nif3-like dinuclear metal center hexameric protein [Prevotella sp.]